ncbi:unnamed protein product [Bursaphelenchus xylophilus]|uniref:(pine wood nematode) hypothetical protein n=1 Tax=Bursaphelenchus xylophilus TaxID=6326 RepID=A0A1I7SWR9_BURXY|nr:unnamed protein product [Bursaphelenchus xylophilus]CAG9099850.1 unnamed protein product [Bursaphelenchus xylophilus]
MCFFVLWKLICYFDEDALDERTMKSKFVFWTGVFPVLSAMLSILAAVAGYVMAVYYGHEDPYVSFITDSGSLSPESCIFGILLNLAAFFFFLTTIFIHVQLKTFLHDNELMNETVRQITRVMVLLGLLSAMGYMMVANFQETNDLYAHWMGGLIAYVAALCYSIMWTIACYIRRPCLTPKSLTLFRGCLILLSLAAISVFNITFYWAPFVYFRDSNGLKPGPPLYPMQGLMRVSETHPYYTNEVVAAISEWLGVFALQALIVTFAYEMGRIDIRYQTA